MAQFTQVLLHLHQGNVGAEMASAPHMLSNWLKVHPVSGPAPCECWPSPRREVGPLAHRNTIACRAWHTGELMGCSNIWRCSEGSREMLPRPQEPGVSGL